MPEEQQFKRHIAFKFRIGDLLIGKPIMDGERFSFLELGDKKIMRVNVMGNIIDKYESEGEKKYSFLTLDDGSGQIKLKSFGIRTLNISFPDIFSLDDRPEKSSTPTDARRSIASCLL